MNNPVSEFERKFAELCGNDYAIAVNSGTSALHAALVALDVRGQNVVMPALCPAMDAFAIIHAGGIPVFADVDPKTHLVTHDTLARAVTLNTKAIIAVSLHGLPCDMAPIMSLANSWGIHVIDDCAQCLFGTYNDHASGTIADIGCFSFEKKKHMTTGSEGGMIVTKDEHLATRARKFAGLGYKHMTADAGRTSLSAAEFQNPDYERFDTIGLNYRMSEVQAQIGMSKLESINTAIERRRQISGMFAQAIAGCSWMVAQSWDYAARNVYYSFAVEHTVGGWLDFYKLFVAKGGDGFYAMPQVPWKEPAIKNSPHNQIYAECPVAERLQQRLMCYKTHYRNMDDAKRQAEILSNLIDEVGR